MNHDFVPPKKIDKKLKEIVSLNIFMQTRIKAQSNSRLYATLDG